jgi:hypothetical protein
MHQTQIAVSYLTQCLGENNDNHAASLAVPRWLFDLTTAEPSTGHPAGKCTEPSWHAAHTILRPADSTWYTVRCFSLLCSPALPTQ